MTSRVAMERAMLAIEERGNINVYRAKASPLDAPKGDQSSADLDAEAWNILRHLSRVL